MKKKILQFLKLQTSRRHFGQDVAKEWAKVECLADPNLEGAAADFEECYDKIAEELRGNDSSYPESVSSSSFGEMNADADGDVASAEGDAADAKDGADAEEDEGTIHTEISNGADNDQDPTADEPYQPDRLEESFEIPTYDDLITQIGEISLVEESQGIETATTTGGSQNGRSSSDGSDVRHHSDSSIHSRDASREEHLIEQEQQDVSALFEGELEKIGEGWE